MSERLFYVVTISIFSRDMNTDILEYTRPQLHLTKMPGSFQQVESDRKKPCKKGPKIFFSPGKR